MTWNDVMEYVCTSIGLNCGKKNGEFYVKTLN